MGVTQSKIEARAIGALQNIIDEHDTMDAVINSHDKEMSWDGYITIYNDDEAGQSKNNYDDRAFIQIKGHEDTSKEYTKRRRISYSVELDDLRAYSKEKGVIYFQIFMDQYQKEIFYNCLYPSKIAEILAKAEKKGNTNSITINFTKLKKDSHSLYKLVKQFTSEGQKQGSAYNDLVKNRIKTDDFEKLTDISFSAVASNNYEIIKGLSDGNICLYGKTSDTGIFSCPLESDWKNLISFSTDEIIKKPVFVNGEKFYDEYEGYCDTDSNFAISLSPNLLIDLVKNRIEITGFTSIRELAHDALFLIKSNESDSITFGNDEFYTNKNFMNPEFAKRVQYYRDLCETLLMIGFDIDTPVTEYTKQQQAQFTLLVEVRFKAAEDLRENEAIQYNWCFDDKLYPIVFYKDHEKMHLYSIFSNEDFYPSVSINNTFYRMPFFLAFDIDTLSNLLFYDYNSLKKQIDSADINKYTAEHLIPYVMELITIYDDNNDPDMLDLAKYLYEHTKPHIKKSLANETICYIELRLGIITEQIKPKELHFHTDITLGNPFDIDGYFGF